MGKNGVAGFDPERLRTVREARRDADGRTGMWTQEHVAELVGVGRTYYILLEAGEYDPRAPVLAKLAEVLEVAPHELTSLDPGELTIRQARQLAGLTQGQAGEQVGLTTSGWAAVERGTRRASPAIAGRIAELLGLDVDQVRSERPG